MESTAEYYKVEAAKQAENIGVFEYMRYAETKLAEEEARGVKYFEKTANSSELLKAVLIQNLIEPFMEHMLPECTRESCSPLRTLMIKSLLSSHGLR